MDIHGTRREQGFRQGIIDQFLLQFLCLKELGGDTDIIYKQLARAFRSRAEEMPNLRKAQGNRQICPHSLAGRFSGIRLDSRWNINGHDGFARLVHNPDQICNILSRRPFDSRAKNAIQDAIGKALQEDA